MKKLTQLGLAVTIMFAVSHQAIAQTFTVTQAGLKKIVAGALVAIPASGTINPGDIVVYPYANNAGNPGTVYTPNFTITANPSGTPSGYSWQTKGDIGIASGGGSTNVADIGTKNLGARTPATYDLDQSKGRVIFNWTNGTCANQTMSFDVIKAFNNTNNAVAIPPIVGPLCIQPNHQYTYSVDPIVSDNLTQQIGLDAFLWDISALTVVSGSTYYSSDSSSITFVTGPSVPASATIKCYFGQANFPPLQTTGSSQAVSSLTLQQAVSTPTISVASTGITPNPTTLTTFPASICLNTNSSTPYTSTLALSVTPVSGYSYSWSWSPLTWTSTPVQPVTGTSVTITTDNNPGTITLTSTGPCGDILQSVITVNRKYNGLSMFTLPLTCITGTSFTINLAGGNSSSGNLSGTPAFNAPYTGLPSGWSASYTNLGVVTVNMGSTPAPANYTVSISNTCTTTPLVYTVSKAPTTPLTITASPSTCGSPGSPITLSVPVVSGITYAWSNTGGTGYSLSPTNTSTVTATIGTAGSTTVNLVETVTSSSPACSANATPVTLVITPSTPTVTGPTCLYWNVATPANAYTFSIPAVAGATAYSWSVTGVALVGTISGGTTTTATLGVAATTSPFTVQCVITTPCGPITASITETPTDGGNGAGRSPGGPTRDFYFLNLAAPSGSTYQWFWDAVPISPAQTADNYTATTAVGSTVDVCIQVTSTVSGCTSVSRYCTPAVNHKIAPYHGNGATNLKNIIQFYPNPNSGSFTVDVPVISQQGTVSVLDISGKKVIERPLKEGKNDFEMKLPPAVYQLIIVVDGKQQNERMVIAD